jgi:hypothetical protein
MFSEGVWVGLTRSIEHERAGLDRPWIQFRLHSPSLDPKSTTQPHPRITFTRVDESNHDGYGLMYRNIELFLISTLQSKSDGTSTIILSPSQSVVARTDATAVPWPTDDQIPPARTKLNSNGAKPNTHGNERVGRILTSHNGPQFRDHGTSSTAAASRSTARNCSSVENSHAPSSLRIVFAWSRDAPIFPWGPQTVGNRRIEPWRLQRRSFLPLVHTTFRRWL